jgi:dTMP kinase
MRTLNQGILIAIEGIDGSGKSTLAKSLYQQLTKDQYEVVLTKEPGATALGKQLRPLLQEKNVAVCPKAEFLLFAADRAQHFQELIIPALNQYKIVISDRMNDSSLVYQGYGRGLDHKTIETVNAWAMEHLKPDITFYIDLPLDLAFKRLENRQESLTSFEKEGKAFTQKLRDGFETLYRTRKDVIRLDGTQLPETIATQAYNEITERISKQ